MERMKESLLEAEEKKQDLEEEVVELRRQLDQDSKVGNKSALKRIRFMHQLQIVAIRKKELFFSLF